MLASIKKLIIKMVGLPAGVLYTHVEVREALSGLAGNVQVQVIKVLSEAQNVREILGKVKDVLDSIAPAALGDSEVLRTVLPTGRTKSLAWGGLVGLVGLVGVRPRA
jgi:hypothetical protein